MGVGNCGAIPGHLIPNYPHILNHGWESIQTDADANVDDLSATEEKRNLARAISICGDGVRAFANRYALEAERLAAQETDLARQAELLQIAEISKKVPWKPAENFPEALQSLWLTHILVLIAESYPGPGVSPGRIDQYLFPFYQNDIESGRLNQQQAKEWLRCLWIKHNYAYDYQGWVGTNQGINASFGQLITLGGIDEHGEDASNDLTYLLLDVIEEMNLLEPKPNVRIHAKTPARLLNRVVDMVLPLPGSLKQSLRRDKILLREAAAKYLPPSTATRRKRGFEVPIGAWLRGPLRPALLDLLSWKTITRQGLLQPQSVGRLVDEHLGKKEDHGRALWALVVLSAWLDSGVTG